MNKKYLLLFLSIPMYCCLLFMEALFYETQFLIRDVLCFSAFVLSAAVLLVLNRTAVKTAAAVGLQIVWLTLSAKEAFGLTVNHTLAYCLSCLPAIYFIAVLSCFPPSPAEDKKNDRSGNKQKQRGKASGAQKKSRPMPPVFYILPAVFTVYSLIRLIGKRSYFHFAVNAAGVFFAAVCCLLLFCIFKIRGLSFPEKRTVLPFLGALCAVTFLNGLSYVLYLHALDSPLNGSILFSFPAFLTVVLFFDRFQTVRQTVFPASLLRRKTSA